MFANFIFNYICHKLISLGTTSLLHHVIREERNIFEMKFPSENIATPTVEQKRNKLKETDLHNNDYEVDYQSF